ALIHGRVLAGEPDQLAHLVRVALDVVPADPGLALVGPDQRGQYPDGGCLAGAVRPEQAEHPARPRRQVHSGQCSRLPESLDQPPGLNRVGCISHVLMVTPATVKPRTNYCHPARDRLPARDDPAIIRHMASNDMAWARVDATHVPPEIDPTKPSVARVYDAILGGKDNFAADR